MPLFTRILHASAFALPLCATAQFTVYTSANSDLTDDYIASLAPDDDAVWVGTAAGLNHFDGTTWTNWTTDNSDLPADVVTDLAVDQSGNLFSWNYDQGCSRFDGTTFTHYTMADGLGSNLGSNVMLLNNAMYAGTYGGLSQLGSSWSNLSTDNSGLPNNDVRDCDIDITGGLWVPTFGGGIAYFSGIWTTYNTGNSELPDDEVFVARVHPSGHVWIGTRNGLVDNNAGEFTVYTSDNSILEDNDIRNIEFGNEGEVVICTRNGGVYTIGSDGNWTAYTTGNSNLPSDETWESLVDADGNLWIATSAGLATIQGWSAPNHVAEETAFADAQVTLHNGRLRIALADGAAQVRVSDATGRAVWNSASPVRGVQEHAITFVPGVYHVTLAGQERQRTWKVLAE